MLKLRSHSEAMLAVGNVGIMMLMFRAARVVFAKRPKTLKWHKSQFRFFKVKVELETLSTNNNSVSTGQKKKQTSTKIALTKGTCLFETSIK